MIFYISLSIHVYVCADSMLWKKEHSSQIRIRPVLETEYPGTWKEKKKAVTEG